MLLSAAVELALFSLPSLIYVVIVRRRNTDRERALVTVGIVLGRPVGYLWAVGIMIITAPLVYLALWLVPTSISHTPNVVVGAASTRAGYAAAVLHALAEEMLFRGFIAGLLFRRFGFGVGNIIQTLVFLAPHLLLLLISRTLWPLLALQSIAGWLLGWLRYRSHSVGPSWLAHAGANILTSVVRFD